MVALEETLAKRDGMLVRGLNPDDNGPGLADAVVGVLLAGESASVLGAYPAIQAYVEGASSSGESEGWGGKALAEIYAGAQVDAARWDALEVRQESILASIDALKAQFDGLGSASGADGASSSSSSSVTSKLGAPPPTDMGAAVGPEDPPVREIPQTRSAVWDRLENECVEKGMTGAVFKRAPPEYYESSLHWRRAALGAQNIHQLCKSIVFINKKAPKDIVDCSNPKNSKYYCAIVQYTHKIRPQDLEKFVKEMNPGMGKKKFHFRLVPEDISAELTGYGHNAVSPLGMATDIPIVLDAAITRLPSQSFWLGAGEVDLKVRLNVDEFVQGTNCFVADFSVPLEEHKESDPTVQA